MKAKKTNEIRNKRGPFLWIIIALCLTFTGCASFGPLVLNNAVIKYDNNVLQSEEELLLLNIVRMHDDQPPHFTVASAVQATFTLSGTGTVAPIGTTTSAYGVSIGTTISDSPTITIVPMQGKDYSERLLRPIDSHFVNTVFLQQGAKRIDKMLRLIGRDFTMLGPDKSKTIFESIEQPDFKGDKYKYPDLTGLTDIGEEEASCLLKDVGLCVATNKPQRTQLNKDQVNYELFRKIVLHIRALSLTNRLQIFALDLDVPYRSIKKSNTTKSDTKKTNATKSDSTKTNATKTDATKSNSTKATTTKPDATKPVTIMTDTKKTVTTKTGTAEPVTTKTDTTKTVITKPDITKPDTTKPDTTKPDTAEPDNTKTDTAETDTTNTDTAEITKTDTTETDTTKTNALNTDGIKDTVDALEKNFHWKETTEGLIIAKHYRITTLTDFDFAVMNPYVRDKLIEEIQKDLELNDTLNFDEGVILVLVRGDRENRWPICGYFCLRNVTQVLQFLAESLNDQHECEYEREYSVSPSPLTEKLLASDELPFGCLDNPALTLTINSSPKMTGQLPKDRFIEVDYKGESFWISCPWIQRGAKQSQWVRPDPLRWDKEVFNMLYEIYQFNRSESPVGPPSVSISK
ncbi:MAG: hypothetical protein ACLQDI_20210 [Syntrophobacteraceae bacterium]